MNLQMVLIPRRLLKHSTKTEDKADDAEDDISSKLAFHADPDKLDEEGKPKCKMSRKMSRNESEKLRRDRLNAYIGELAKLVPLILTANRKMDKSSVLRLTVNYLRMYHDLAKNPEFRRQWRPEFLNSENLGNMLLESTGGFLLVISRRGTLTFCTDAITNQLGHNLVDILGNSIFSIVHPDDHAILQKQFYSNGHSAYSPELERLLPRSTSRSFYIRMLDSSVKQSNKYQSVHVVAQLKCVPPVAANNSQPGVFHLSEPDICLVGVARIDYMERPKELLPIMDSNSDEWVTRHEMDGKLTFSDPRCAYISGFMPQETNGMSPYALVHKDDICVVVAAHNIFMTTGSVPTTCFRMYTKSQQIVYVRTHTNMVVDMWTSRPRFIVSINQVLGEEEGKKALQAIKEQLELVTEATADLSIENTKSDDEETEIDDVEKVPLSPRSPQVPEIVMEAQDRLSIYVDKDKVYNVELKMAEFDIRKADSKNVAENIVFDPYPPINTATSPYNSHEVTLSPKPVFLGTTPSQPNSRHNSFSHPSDDESRDKMQHSPIEAALADSATSPSDVTSTNPSRSNLASSHQALLQQLNKRMAAAPPQLQPVQNVMQNSSSCSHSEQLPDYRNHQQQVPSNGYHANQLPSNGYHANQVRSNGYNGSQLQNHAQSHAPKNGYNGTQVAANPILVQLLANRPLPQLCHDNYHKIYSELPERWQETIRANAMYANFHEGNYGNNTMVSEQRLVDNNPLNAQFMQVNMCQQNVGETSPANYPNPLSNQLSDPSNEFSGPGSQSSGLGTDISSNQDSPPNCEQTHDSSPLNNVVMASMEDIVSITPLPKAPCTTSPERNQQLQNQLELLKEIEARREAHEKALRALQQEYALQVKQLVSDTNTNGTQSAASTQQSLATAQDPLATTQQSVATAQESLATTQQSLALTQQSLGTTLQSLATTPHSLAATHQSLVNTQQTLATSNRQAISTGYQESSVNTEQLNVMNEVFLVPNSQNDSTNFQLLVTSQRPLTTGAETLTTDIQDQIRDFAQGSTTYQTLAPTKLENTGISDFVPYESQIGQAGICNGPLDKQTIFNQARFEDFRNKPVTFSATSDLNFNNSCPSEQMPANLITPGSSEGSIPYNSPVQGDTIQSPTGLPTQSSNSVTATTSFGNEVIEERSCTINTSPQVGSLDSFSDSSLLLGNEMITDSDVDVNTLLHILLTSDNTVPTALGNTSDSSRDNKMNFDDVKLSVNSHTMQDSEMASIQETKTLLQKLKDANVSPAQYLKVLTQLHSTDHRTSEKTAGLPPTTNQQDSLIASEQILALLSNPNGGTKNEERNQGLTSAAKHQVHSSTMSSFTTSSNGAIGNMSVYSPDTSSLQCNVSSQGNQLTNLSHDPVILSTKNDSLNTKDDAYYQQQIRTTRNLPASTIYPVENKSTEQSNQSYLNVSALLPEENTAHCEGSENKGDKFNGYLQKVLESGEKHMLETLLRGGNENLTTVPNASGEPGVFSQEENASF